MVSLPWALNLLLVMALLFVLSLLTPVLVLRSVVTVVFVEVLILARVLVIVVAKLIMAAATEASSAVAFEHTLEPKCTRVVRLGEVRGSEVYGKLSCSTRR